MLYPSGFRCSYDVVRCFGIKIQRQGCCLVSSSTSAISQWLERRTRDRKVAGSNPCWSGGRIFFSMVNFLC